MRQHIIDVARAIITHKGYSAVGISEIVKAADIPKGSFYYYFPSKERLQRRCWSTTSATICWK
ncbi:TetR/AcrR family transcriptional regulator [Pantoea agglomerans]|uniref:TetR/AcrR family transcriptional regulator n=1 Tax=Enterobacter agglomerans TaxID=549 RepID=UPI001F23F1D0|nr:helix-turn-helix domain-containing protein [Pantoea agglomerans]